MNEYKKEYKNIEFKDFKLSVRKGYRVFNKLFTVRKSFYEYVAYINPGTDIPLIISLSMNKQEKKATNSEIDALNLISSSIELFMPCTTNISK